MCVLEAYRILVDKGEERGCFGWCDRMSKDLELGKIVIY